MRPRPLRPVPEFGPETSDVARMIIEDNAVWQGSVRNFLHYEPARVDLPPNQIIRVLKISKMISSKKIKSPHCRGSTQKLQPGTILVTDGKGVSVHLTASKQTRDYNWQGMVDQTTVCHTAVVVTETENAQGVVQAYEQSVDFLGHKPEALVHDNKPIHEDRILRQTVEPDTTMIPATPRRPENKAAIEGEFGKFGQAVGCIDLDDSSLESLTNFRPWVWQDSFWIKASPILTLIRSIRKARFEPGSVPAIRRRRSDKGLPSSERRGQRDESLLLSDISAASSKSIGMIGSNLPII
jgi:hypothetical protein